MDLRRAPDAELVAWMIEGREGCVGELMARYGPAVSSLLRRATGGSPDAEDLAQETWLRVVRHANRYHPDDRGKLLRFRVARRWRGLRARKA